MSEIKHTRGPWLRKGTLIYSLQHHGWRKGEETFCNRFSAAFSLGPGCTEEELIANAVLAQAAPELLEALRLCYDHCRLYHPEVERNNVGKAVRTAIAKAEGKS